MANKTINDLTEDTSPQAGDFLPTWDVSASGTKKTTIRNSQLVGECVQIASSTYSAVATGTADIPADDTIPQITEGDEYMTCAITPLSATNILVIEVVAHLSRAAANGRVTGALFQDATADAIAAGELYISAATSSGMLIIKHKMTAGTISSTTFRFRAGEESGGGSTLTFNGVSGARRYGAIPKSSIVIREYKA